MSQVHGGSDYGDYDDGPRRYRNTRTRPRRGDDPDFVEETTYVERGKGPPPRDLVYRRGRDQDDSVEDIDRDFPPPSGRSRGYRSDDYEYSNARRSRSAYDRRDSYDDYDDYAAPAAGAAAGYAAGRTRSSRGGRSRRDDYYSDEDRDSPERKPERRKSGIEGALESLGLGGIAGALTGGGKDKDRSRSRSRGPGGRGGSEEGSERGKDPKLKQRQWAQAAQAALVAGAIEAFRSRGEPGPWTGDKGKRIATAAIAAGGVDKLVDKDPDRKSKRHLAEAVLGGLAANRLANGPRSRGRDDSRGRSRSRSRSIIDRFRSKSRGRSASSERSGASRKEGKGGAIKDLAAGGALAAAGKAIYDRVRSRSRGGKRRDPSSGSEDSYVPSRSRRRDREVGSYSQSRDMGPDGGAVVNRGQGALAGAGAAAAGAGDGEGGERGGDDNESSSSSTTDIENQRKKMRGKEFLTAGLASVATIHAAHGVYSSMKASDKRHTLVAEGEMTPEEARKKRSKAWLQDAASVGIAALGIKGAYSEWKEMNEQRHTMKELEEKRRQRRKKRERRMREARMNGGVYPGRNGQYLMDGGASGRQIGPPPANDYYQGGDYNNARAGDLPPPPMGGGGRH